MTKLQVLHLIGGGDTGGAMSHLLPLLSALERAECEVHLVCLGGGKLAENAADRGLSVTVMTMANARDLSVLMPLRRVLAGGPAALTGRVTPATGTPTRWDIVHTHGTRANLPVRLAARFLRHRPCLATTIHSDMRRDYSSGLVAGLYVGLDRLTLPAVDIVICVSEGLRTLLVRRGYPAERMVTIHSGIELSSAVAGATTTATQMGEPFGTRPRIGVVGRLVPVKDLDLFLEVAGLLHRTIPELEAVVIGDGPERRRLEAQAQARGLDRVVRFTGRLADVHPELDQMDVYVVTSVFEGGVSMAVLEAMAAAVPVVTTAAGGVAEAVKDGETGFVVARDQERGLLAAALAERAAVLLSDPELRATTGAAGAKRVQELFSVERTAAETVRAYRRGIAARQDAIRRR